MSKISFCIFSDLHYWSGQYPTPASGLETIMKNAAQKGVDFVIHCGDFCHNAATAPELMKIYYENEYGLPTFGCLGNHELEDTKSLQDVCSAYKMSNNYEYHDFSGFRLIMLDTDYYYDPQIGKTLHNAPYTNGGPVGLTSNYLGNEQIVWLENTLETSPYPCILFSHDSFERDNCVSPNAAKVREIIARENAAHTHKVILCCNGHYHRDSINVVENVAYFNVNATYNVDWSPVKHRAYPPEFVNATRMASNCCLAAEPLHAFVTVEDNGHIIIKGMKTGYLYGVSPESVGWHMYDPFGLPPSTRISGANIQL